LFFGVFFILQVGESDRLDYYERTTRGHHHHLSIERPLLEETSFVEEQQEVDSGSSVGDRSYNNIDNNDSDEELFIKKETVGEEMANAAGLFRKMVASMAVVFVFFFRFLWFAVLLLVAAPANWFLSFFINLILPA